MHKVLLWFICINMYLGLSDGYLALWKEGSLKPEKVFPYHISLYTKNDHDELQKGITIRSEEELSKQIEDFLS